jgi:nickel-dependent lactate racemase
MRDARSVEGSIEDNPLHRELLEIARMARHDFMVDVALTRDRKIAGVFAGQRRRSASHGRQIRVASDARDGRRAGRRRHHDSRRLSARSHLLPGDQRYTAASHIVKSGGKILLIAACEEGAGAGEFSRMLAEHPSDRQFMDHIASRPVVVDQWQLEKLGLVTSKLQALY